jgi:hypothetical protein
MRAKKGKTENLREVDRTQALDEFEEVLLFEIPEGEAVEGGSGHHVVNGGFAVDEQPRDTRHSASSVRC